MSLIRPLVLGCALALSACATVAPQPKASPAPAPAAQPAAAAAVPADDNLNAALWSQRAVEHDMIYEEVFRNAQAKLAAALKDPTWDALPKDDRTTPVSKKLKPAVVLDIDETVLDNSPYQVRVIRGGGEFNEADWAAWCKEAVARAMPGAVAFTQWAASHGIAVIYVSNRAKDLDEPTLRNLRQAGLPVSGPEAFLGLGTFVPDCEQIGTEKGCRRQLIASKYRVLMQFGDQLGDFVTVLANTPEGREKAIAPYRAWVGERWFVLPNPTYGSWEPAVFNNDYTLPREERRKLKIGALRDK